MNDPRTYSRLDLPQPTRQNDPGPHLLLIHGVVSWPLTWVVVIPLHPHRVGQRQPKVYGQGRRHAHQVCEDLSGLCRMLGSIVVTDTAARSPFLGMNRHPVLHDRVGDGRSTRETRVREPPLDLDAGFSATSFAWSGFHNDLSPVIKTDCEDLRHLTGMGVRDDLDRRGVKLGLAPPGEPVRWRDGAGHDRDPVMCSRAVANQFRICRCPVRSPGEAT
jgi:hypothetical protein